MRQTRQASLLLMMLIGLTSLLVSCGADLTVIEPTRSVQAASSGSIGFRGYAVNDIDRVKIRIDPQVLADVGGDFTLEFWLKTNAGDNPGGSCSPSASAGDGWINGHIIVDRDIDDNFGTPRNGDYGISMAQGRICFGVARHQGGGATIFSSGHPDLRDGAWHHIAVTRASSNGQMRIFVDGVQRASGTGPTGDVSYLDGRTVNPQRANSDPFLVLGAEKHDYAGVLGYRGLLDELRISSSVRYTVTFVVPTSAFSPDAQTAALYHFDEGTGTAVVDASNSNGSPGVLNVGGGPPSGPYWSTDTPFGGTQATSTPTATRTSTGTPTATATPTATSTRTPTRTATPVPTGTVRKLYIPLVVSSRGAAR